MAPYRGDHLWKVRGENRIVLPFVVGFPSQLTIWISVSKSAYYLDFGFPSQFTIWNSVFEVGLLFRFFESAYHLDFGFLVSLLFGMLVFQSAYYLDFSFPSQLTIWISVF